MIGNDCSEIDQSLASKIALAMRWFGEVKTGASINAVAEREGLTRDRVSQILWLAWLAWLDPKIVDAASSGRQPERLTTDAILMSRSRTTRRTAFKRGDDPLAKIV